MSMRKTTGEMKINKHFDNIAERIKTMKMPERLLADNEEKRKKWLDELHKYGEVNYMAMGEDWTMRPHTENTAIYNLRKRSGLTRKQFAEKYHIPIRTLEKWERDEVKPAEYLVEWLERIVNEDFGESQVTSRC